MPFLADYLFCGFNDVLQRLNHEDNEFSAHLKQKQKNLVISTNIYLVQLFYKRDK